MKRAFVLGLFLIAAAALTAGGAVFWASSNFEAPGPLIEAKVMIVDRGQGVRQIARKLENQGIIQHEWLFAAMVRWRGDHSRLAAGEYRFEAGISPQQVLSKLLRHDTVVRSITIPEGLTSREVIALVAAEEGLSGDLRALDAPQGRFLPETYHFSFGDDRTALLGRMSKSMQDLESQLWNGRQTGLPLRSWEEAVILASIVEKETGLAEERPHIASVFINRLNRGMRLQSDPTVQYALTEGREELGRPLTRQDWKVKHPFNTYVIQGLPPGPIANPGRAAIEAVLNPIASKDLYFVADGTGGHAFARTLAEHNRNVAKWRKIKRQKNQ